MRALIADDDESTRFLLKRFLQKLGYQAEEHTDGSTVQSRIFKGDIPQLLLLDWMMPHHTGIELSRLVREKADLPFTYIILLTSKADKEDVIEGLRAGANDYLTKPLRLEELQSRLEVANQMIHLSNLVTQQRAKLVSSSKLASLGEMAAGIAHEINNPLAIINGRAVQLGQMLRSNIQEKELMVKMSQTIIDTTDRIAKIIRGLRTFASEGEAQPFEDISVSKLIEDTLTLCGEKFIKSHVQLNIKLARPDLALECQSVRVCQILLNLLSNAAYAVKSQAEHQINIEAIEDSDSIYISVGDNGPGITPEIRAKLMQPFFTTKPFGVGTGLGLSISRGIAESHGGTLSLDEHSPFTRFVLTLPKNVPARLKPAA